MQGAPPIEAEVFQTLESGPTLYRFGVHLYNWIQRHCPALHHVYFNALEVLGLHEHASGLEGTAPFEAKLREFRPQVIVSTHAHLNHGYFAKARRILHGQVRCTTYCGELHGGYGFSRFWVNPAADYFAGAVSETCDEAARLNMPPEKTMRAGFLLNPKFWEAPETDLERNTFVREELKLDPEQFILVLGTGANSANNHLKLLDALKHSELRPQIVALCGRSEAAFNAVRSWARAQDAFAVRALPYCDRMPELLRAASALIARPGTGTTSEAILCGCPLIFNGIGGVMPQERITLEFARARGFGRRLKRPSQLPGLLRPLMQGDARLRSERVALQAARPAEHPLDFLRMVHELGQSVSTKQ